MLLGSHARVVPQDPALTLSLPGRSPARPSSSFSSETWGESTPPSSNQCGGSQVPPPLLPEAGMMPRAGLGSQPHRPWGPWESRGEPGWERLCKALMPPDPGGSYTQSRACPPLCPPGSPRAPSQAASVARRPDGVACIAYLRVPSCDHRPHPTLWLDLGTLTALHAGHSHFHVPNGPRLRPLPSCTDPGALLLTPAPFTPTPLGACKAVLVQGLCSSRLQ